MKKIISLIIAIAVIATMGVVSVYAADITNVEEEYTEGEPIVLNFTDADRSNNEWICIYVDGTVPGLESNGGTPSVQYAYIGGDGTITFNDITNTVGDREAVLAASDATYSDEGYIYYNDPEAVKALPVGDYYAIILGGADWYEEVSDAYYFSVVEAIEDTDDATDADEATEEPTEEVTEEPTEEPTEEVTEEPTEEPEEATEEPTEEPTEEEKGCGSVVASGAAVVMLAVAGAFLAKKRED